MKKSKTSQRWLDEHEQDPYVLKARSAGYRSRAVYKLIELDDRLNLFREHLTVVDLGAAPGWLVSSGTAATRNNGPRTRAGYT